MKKSEVSSQRFVVLGAARSGIAAAKLLKSHGGDVVVADNKPADQAQDTIQELNQLGIPSAWGDSDVATAIAGRTIMVKSPGIPQDNPAVAAARAAGTRIISEIELAAAFVPDRARVVAITGTNGKTTVTAWLAHVLNACGLSAIPAGNIGDAWCNQLLSLAERPEQPCDTVFVVEVSSFQLENLEDFRPDVAVLTNISPDHMDRYNDQFDLYVAAKTNILKNMTPENVFIWNAANAASKPLAEMSPAENLPYTTESAAAAQNLAGWIDHERIMIRRNGKSVHVLPLNELPLPGAHNLENALAVILAASALGVDMDAIAEGVKTFPGVEHRIEHCGTRADGVKFFNDSKATNLDAMEKAVVAFNEPIILIAGGRDAHSDYTTISHLIKNHVAHLVTLGEAAELIEEAWAPLVPTRRASTMAEAVALAHEVAEPGTVVVFSPACKSFDMYLNYEERGRDYKTEVARLLETE